MAGPIMYSTGIIDNRAPNPGTGRPVTNLVIRVENNETVAASAEGVPIILIEVFNETPSGGGFGNQSTYSLNQFSLGDVNQSASTFTLDNVFANLDNFGVRYTLTSTGSFIISIPTVTVTGKNENGTIIATYPLSAVT
ncbi:hypothetical protein GZH47_00230 [Paenibacillus rhizovicinus]|uniref:Uncharacterized protein n=1 Tax=Paenibacillus rhizovicinus TaxID=2704463 RepID=A0A6C0NTC3_9BACL|nr:hypothetical protein [Paenibacillus rhizovicinus]QHW29407.1 hypothetical protein GZH47_00230 [Paenibacillus rhizovicinus]